MPQMSSPSQSMLSHVVQLPTAWCCYQSRCKRRLSSAQQETLPTEAASSLQLHNACALAFCHLVVCVCHIGVHVFLQQYIPSQSYVVLYLNDWVQGLAVPADCCCMSGSDKRRASLQVAAMPRLKLWYKCKQPGPDAAVVPALLNAQITIMPGAPVHPRRHSSAWRFGCGVLWAPA